MFTAILIGLFIGIIAKFLLPGDDPGGIIITTLLGVAGAAVAAFIGRELGYYQPTQPAGFLASIGGAMLLLLLYRVFRGRRA